MGTSCFAPLWFPDSPSPWRGAPCLSLLLMPVSGRLCHTQVTYELLGPWSMCHVGLCQHSGDRVWVHTSGLPTSIRQGIKFGARTQGSAGGRGPSPHRLQAGQRTPKPGRALCPSLAPLLWKETRGCWVRTGGFQCPPCSGHSTHLRPSSSWRARQSLEPRALQAAGYARGGEYQTAALSSETEKRKGDPASDGN